MTTNAIPTWTMALTNLSRFCHALGRPMATRDRQSGEWTGEGFFFTAISRYGINLMYLEADGVKRIPFGFKGVVSLTFLERYVELTCALATIDRDDAARQLRAA